jgi:hypothetical protein
LRGPLFSHAREKGLAVNAMIPRTLESIPGVPPNPAQPGSSWLASWAHRDFIELGPYDTAPKTVRGLVKERLPAWGLGDLVEAAELVASELVTNSVQATCAYTTGPRLPPVRVWLLASATQVVILVWDDIAQGPVEQAAGDDDENGRGLLIVRQLSAGWNYWLPRDPYTGKVTWAILSLP